MDYYKQTSKVIKKLSKWVLTYSDILIIIKNIKLNFQKSDDRESKYSKDLKRIWDGGSQV